jgi:hypothetical protein
MRIFNYLLWWYFGNIYIMLLTTNSMEQNNFDDGSGRLVAAE